MFHFNTGNNDSGSQVVRIGQPLNNIIDNYCQRVRDDLRSIESSNIGLVLEYNQLFEAKCKLDKEVEMYHDRVKQLSMESSRQVEIINRLENIIMGCAPLLPQEEQFKLSTAVYAAKQVETDQLQQVSIHQVNACDRRLKSIDELDEPNNLEGSNSPDDQQSTMTANQQQAAVINAIQLLQILSSQVVDHNKMNSNTIASNVRPKKKPVRKQRPTTIKKIDQGDSSTTSTQKDIAATGAGSQQPQASQGSASQATANRNLKQTSMYDYLS